METLQVDDLWYSGLPTPEGSQGSSDQVDSPLQDGRATGRSSEERGDVAYKSTPSKRATKSPANKLPASKPKGSDTMNGSAFRFVVVDHPNKLRDRQEMRENRMHVMHDYLNKERRRPGSLDSRVNGSTRTKKIQNPSNASAAQKSQSGSPSSTNSFPVDTSRFTPAASPENKSDCSSEKDSTERSNKRAAPASRCKGGPNGEPAALIRRVYNPPSDDVRLVSGVGGRWEFSAYMRATPGDIPHGLGSKLEPFGTWPALVDPSLDVNALKWSCSQRFGSDGLAANWIPALLRARHAFLSTLCISSSHDAIMSRALAPNNLQNSYKSIARWKIKMDVLKMLAECMKEPESSIADETMVSVVHLLVSDIMACDDRELKIHQMGLQNMAAQRGGLDKLGVGGELAAIIVIMSYLIGSLREVQPPHDFMQFALKQDTRIPTSGQPLPESPIYCPPSGFRTIHRVTPQGSDIHELLETVRTLTNRFYIENTQLSAFTIGHHRQMSIWEHSDETVATLATRIFAFAPARDKEFNDMNERYTYEAIRLTSLVYAHALLNKIPFSKAAAELSRRDSATASPGGRKTSDSSAPDHLLSMPMQIKYALVRTDVSFCWDHMGGVLYWISLIGGAAANPGPFADEEREGEEEDARKFLAAIAVRCTVTLGFEYGGAVLETLKRLVTIESALAAPEQETETIATISPDPWNATLGPCCELPKSFGPVIPSEMQKGFADFVQDFLSG